MGFDFCLAVNTVFCVKVDVFLVEHIGEAIGSGFKVKKTSAFCLFYPGIVIAVAVEDDSLMLLDNLFDDSFDGRIKKFITFDETSFNCSTNACVGSHRYEVEVLTEGGHSWSDFGKENAIAEISKIINAVYSIRVPQKKGKKVSFNVGSISGGTSVNTIAQKAAILCEYRSDDVSLLAFMKSEFERIFKEARTDGVKVNVTLLGERPCTDGVDTKKIEELMKIAENVVFDVTGEGLVFHSASTDCNIPMSLGIPAIAIGVYKGKGTHTREECLEKASLPIGLEIGIKAALKYSEE